MNVAMLGAGYVGLVSSACFAEFGASVTCIDIDSARIDKLREGVIPIYEPGLADLINKNMAQGRLSFRAGYDAAIAECDLVFIAVGTPARRGDGHADLKYVYQAARDIASVPRRLHGDSGQVHRARGHRTRRQANRRRGKSGS